MERQHNISLPSLHLTSQVVVLDAQPGRDRLEVMQQWLQESQNNGATTWLLSCDSHENGLWAGLNDFLNELMPQIQQKAPHLITKHSYELAMVLPALRHTISVPNPNLTDSALGEERVRNYALDRAYRIVHGLINLLDAWYPYTDGSPWVIACDRYDRAGVLVRRFFSELMRRRGKQLNLTLLLGTNPGTSETVANQFDTKCLVEKVSLNLPPQPEISVSKEEMRRLAQELEQHIGRDLIEAEIHGSRLIYYWLLSDQPENALIWQARVLGIYNHQGFYEDALIYCEAVATQLEDLCKQDNQLRWNIVGNLFNCYATAGNSARAYQIVQEEALFKIDTPNELVRVYYLMAMFHARFLPERDFAKAEAYLKQSLDLLEETDMPADQKHFMNAFNHNGLALIRHRQGRAAEAVELCQSGIERLKAHLRLDQHQLHRSVLHYNIAQVYASVGMFEEAVTYFTAAISADPNYSEYYNERGNAYQKMGRLEEAVNDYQKAIEFSPPYYEVWMNLGRCYHLRGQIAEAADAYSVALDLNPTQVPALIGRAQAFEFLEQPEAALADYNAALTLNPSQPLLLANRAALHYELGHLPEALSDLDEAIRCSATRSANALSADNPDLYQNRAVVLTALGRLDAAAFDLQTYLRLNPDASDRSEVESELLTLTAS
ncbi:MAG: tetratricopeptide repeat protein [Aphanothece sp. CMT-3BRIN-NPC111]|jgi:tetratricopeptide (TPR) repeat protein|nr:tetratricopeptide repeat protein [Aphanothece sp. CMT-3BRIN-NPC111]